MPERDGETVPAGCCGDISDDNSTRAAATPLTSQEFDIYHVRRVVAGNPNTPKQVLARLAGDQLPGIRQRVAENPKTPVEVLVSLAADEHPDVRLAVAENSNTPPEVLATLATDCDLDVRYGVAENPHMPEEILLRLSDDENPYVRCRALKTLQMMSPEVQSRLQMMMQPGFGSTYRQGY
jgi:hypothetical protein